MASPENKVRVFISSTFRDMHAERDHLVTVVFPELRERCERLGLEFFDVDLRWGVPEKGVDGESANSWEYCRKWIDRVEPFFVCMLGQRYGWEPEPEQLKDASDRARQLEQRRSITDMEVRYAVFNTTLKRHSYFYLRDAEAPATATDFVDPPSLLAKLDQLKTEVRICGRPVRDYPCTWKDNAFTSMEEFGTKVLADLWSGVLRDERYVSKDVWRQVLGTDPAADPRYTDESIPVPDDIAEKLIPLAKPPPKDALEAERDEMQRFADSRLRWFQGRTKELEELKQFIATPSEHNQPRLAVVAAVPGQGKSALMAKLWEELRHSSFELRHSTHVVAHFVGATEKSSTAYHLVKRLNDELDASGIVFPERPTPEDQPKEEPKLDFQSLCQCLWDRLGDYAGERRIVILLDALNQLDDGHDLGWLPNRLGPSVRIVVSCIEEADKKMDGKNKDSENLSANHFSASNAEASPATKVLAALDSRYPKPKRIPLGPLTADDIRTIVTSYLKEYCKELDAPHLDAICDETKLPQARNPLYLLVMLAELRTLGGNDMNQCVPALIASMGTQHPDTVSLFHWVLQRLEQAEGFGVQAVRWWCLYLALGRVGMSSRELSDLLVRKLGDDAAHTAQRIERALRRYLQRRGEQCDFFHAQLRQAVMERCTHQQKWIGQTTERTGETDATIRKAHSDVATYFRDLADTAGDKSWKGGNLRAFNEIAQHLIGAEEWDDLCSYLTDFRCLDRRLRAEQVFNVVTDQRAALATLPEVGEESSREHKPTEICARYGEALIRYARDHADGKNPPLPQAPVTLEAAASPGRAHSLRAESLHAIGNFILEKATLIAVHPTEFLAWAANSAGGGPLAEAADASLMPWIHRDPTPPAPPGRPLYLQILVGHTDTVSSVSVTPDGRRAVSASWDGTVRVWDLQSGQCLHTLDGHMDFVESVCVTPDGRRAVSGGRDNNVRVWDLDSGQGLQTLRGHTDSVPSVSITPDGRRAVSASRDNTVRVWELQSGRCILTLTGHTKTVWSVSVTPDGRCAVSASWDGTVRVWDLERGHCLRTLQNHSGEVHSVGITPDGRRAVSGTGGLFCSSDNSLRIWDTESGQCLFSMPGHTSGVSSVSVTPDGRRAVSASSDSTVRVWDLLSGQCLQTFRGDPHGFFSVSVTPDGRRAVSGWNKNVRVWNLESVLSPSTHPAHTGAVECVVITPNGGRAVSGARDKTLRVWDLHSGSCLHTLSGHTSSVRIVKITPDGKFAVSTEGHIYAADHTLRVWDLQSGECLQTLVGHTDSVLSVSVATDNRRAVSAGMDNTLRVWDLQTGQCLHTLQGHTSRVTSVSVTPDGRRVVSAGWGETLRIWDLESGDCRRIYKEFAQSVIITPDGRHVISQDFGKTMSVWEVESGQHLHTLVGHTDHIECYTVTQDGKRAVSGGQDSTLRVWDLQTGKCLYTLQGHTMPVTNVCATSDGRYILSASWDKTMRVWDLGSGQCLALYRTENYRVTSIATSPICDRIVCGAEDGQMHFLTPRNFPPPA